MTTPAQSPVDWAPAWLQPGRHVLHLTYDQASKEQTRPGTVARVTDVALILDDDTRVPRAKVEECDADDVRWVTYHWGESAHHTILRPESGLGQEASVRAERREALRVAERAVRYWKQEPYDPDLLDEAVVALAALRPHLDTD